MVKDKLYNYFVKKNGRVWYEYERYVREHIEEHHTNRLKHLKVLFKLNWFYRVKKGNTPYLYWDVPVVPEIAIPQQPSRRTEINPKTAGNNLSYPEIGTEKRLPVDEMVYLLSKYDVISFDIFDTLIFRYVSDPKDVFILVGNRLKIYDYKTIRVRAEDDARSNCDNANGEVELHEICELVAKYVGVENERCIKYELEAEKLVCYANPYMFKIAKKLSQMGKTIITTSNMYLNSKQIKDLLFNCGYDFISSVFVSCEEKKSKYKGELQHVVWERIGTDKSVIHVGDNYVADYIGSRMAGWKAYYYRNVNEIGKIFRPAKMSRLASSVYGGIVNGHFHNGLVNESINYELGFGYLGILLVGFCNWINTYADNNAIDKLLFTSRDMRLVYDIYNKYYKKVDNDYILISRFAAQRFSYKRFSDYFIDSHIKARAQIAKLTIKEVLSELDIVFMSEYLEEYELNENEIFTMSSFPKLKDCLNLHKDRMLSEFRNERVASIKYYSQFVKEGQKVAIIDLGWQGTNALCLKYLLEEETDLNLKVSSLLLASCSPREFVQNSFSDGIVDSYCFSMSHNEQLCNHFSGVRMGRFICELMFSSNEKSLKTINLDADNNFTFSYIENEKRNEKSIQEIYKGAEDFVYIWENSHVYDCKKLSGFDAILPLNKISYNEKVCFEIMEGNEINPWIGETKSNAASDIRKLVR